MALPGWWGLPQTVVRGSACWSLPLSDGEVRVVVGVVRTAEFDDPLRVLTRDETRSGAPTGDRVATSSGHSTMRPRRGDLIIEHRLSIVRADMGSE